MFVNNVLEKLYLWNKEERTKNESINLKLLGICLVDIDKIHS